MKHNNNYKWNYKGLKHYKTKTKYYNNIKMN